MPHGAVAVGWHPHFVDYAALPSRSSTRLTAIGCQFVPLNNLTLDWAAYNSRKARIRRKVSVETTERNERVTTR